MKSSLVSLYGKLPAPLRTVAASLRGFSLRRWRYGAETEKLVEEALAREQWDPARWKAWREGQLAFLLHRAATRVPYYREQWSERRRRGDRSSFEKLESWPVLSKEAVRARATAFVADDRDRRSMFHEHTSGTTGQPLNLWSSRETVRKWYALFEARIRRWNGVSRRDRWAIFGGQLVTPVQQRRPPFWVWNAGLRQLYMSSYHIAPETVSAYVNALRGFRVSYILGYASSMFTLAHFALERGIQAPTLSLAISNAEPLYPHQRKTIGEFFGCPVRDTYGMAEIVCAASECSTGLLHLWPEVGVPEVQDPVTGGNVASQQTGKLICTGLLNADMPLVRYELGDLGALSGEGQECACGRTLPLLREVTGRLDDVIVTPEGRWVGRLDPAFKGDIRIREAQVIQESLRDVRVKVVPSDGFAASDIDNIRQRLKERLGPQMTISVEQVSQIPRTAAGKFRAVISLLGRNVDNDQNRVAG